MNSSSDMTKKKFVAPDGGWGWIIVCAYALSSFLLAPMTSGFSMIFGDKFESIGITATEISIIININQGFGMLVGLISVPLLRIYGYRKIAILGQIIYSSGLILTSFSSRFTHFIIAYGMMASLGNHVTMGAISLALHAYFEKKKGRAVGFSLMMTGVGGIILPQLISFLLPIYGSQGTMLLLGAISLNHVVGGLFLQPVEWHAKEVNKNQENSKNGEVVLENKFTMNYVVQEMITRDNKTGNKRSVNDKCQVSTISNDSSIIDSNIINRYEKPLNMKENYVLNVQDLISKNNDLNEDNNYEQIEKVSTNGFKCCNTVRENELRRASYISLTLENPMLISQMYNEKLKQKSKYRKSINSDQIKTTKGNLEVLVGESYEETKKHQRKPKSWLLYMIHQVIELFDLNLLRNRMFVIITVSISMVMFVEINFNALMPLIFTEMSLDMEDVATLMSIIGLSEIVLRGLSPYIGEWLHKPPMAMFLFSLAMLVLTRTALLFTSSRISICIIGICLGIFKGFRIVYMNVLIPNAVSIDQLAAANSIQLLLNGCIMLFGSPILGLIKDISGSYDFCVVLFNVITSLVLILMILEFLVKYIKKRRRLRTFYKLEHIARKINEKVAPAQI